MATNLGGSIVTQAPPNGWNINGYFFDAWLNMHQNNSLTITTHPVETGSYIADHAFINPRKFSFEIGVSNCTAFVGQFSGPKRNISAYQALVTLQGTRDLLTITTKYGVYSNILIESIDVDDTYLTQNTLKAVINLTEVILADAEIIKVSSNPNATDETNRGQVSPVPPLGTWERVVYDWNLLLGTLK